MKSAAHTALKMRGATSYRAGCAAEESVARAYLAKGMQVTERRWIGLGGEVDLIVADGDARIFVEVKRAKFHARAAERIQSKQMRRIAAAAGEYLDTQPKGALTEARFDVALVDEIGRVSVLENAFGCV